MSTAKHPDVVPYARGELLTTDQRATIAEHLTGCEECRDLVLFIHKTNATLLYEGRVSRVACALRMSPAVAWLDCRESNEDARHFPRFVHFGIEQRLAHLLVRRPGHHSASRLRGCDPQSEQ